MYWKMYYTIHQLQGREFPCHFLLWNRDLADSQALWTYIYFVMCEDGPEI